MFAASIPGDHTLDRGQTCIVADARDVVLACKRGALWVTLDGDIRDIVLHGGESLEVGRNALVVVNALRPSRMTIRRSSLVNGACGSAHHEPALRGSR